MAALVKFGHVLRPVLVKRTSISVAAARTASYWNKDWKPGPYPYTPAEREAAAKKYGLRPEDYQPYPDDGTSYGDYPMLPRVATEARPLYEEYDIPELKRNYGEPMHVDADAMVEDRWNPTTRMRFSFNYMRLWLAGVLTFAIGTYLLFDPYPHYLAVMPRQLVGQGGSHYTFEAAD